VAYAVFFGVILLYGLDADDRLVKKAMWAKLRGVVQSNPVSS
jgi:hypothetical protein